MLHAQVNRAFAQRERRNLIKVAGKVKEKYINSTIAISCSIMRAYLFKLTITHLCVV